MIKTYKLTFLVLTLFATNLSANPLKLAAELYRINKIGATKARDITSNALVGKICNIYTALWLPTIGIPRLLLKTSTENEALANAINLTHSLNALTFYALDRELSENAKAIAKYNKEIKRDVGYEKNRQKLWLIANYLIPFISASLFAREKFGEIKSVIDEYDIGNILGNSEHPSRAHALIKALANISEIIRQHYRYKADFGDYKKFSDSSSFDAKELKSFN